MALARRWFWAAALLPCGLALAQAPAGHGPNDPAEPVAPVASLSAANRFLDDTSLAWTRERKCGSCHTNYPYLLARASAPESPAAKEVRAFFEDRAANWETAKPRWDAEVVATAATLALHDAATTKKLHPLTKKALDWMWRLQKEDGSWGWLKCGWPPYEHDDYYGAAYAALGVAAAPDGYASGESARVGVARLRSYLAANPAPDLHHRMVLLWADARSPGWMSAADRRAAVQAVFGAQRTDGGWSLPSLGDYKRKDGSANDRNAPSDGFATGFALVVLREAGTPASDFRVRRGVAWLKRNQRASGRWFTRSLSNDRFHYITHAGTAFAALALQACGEGA